MLIRRCQNDSACFFYNDPNAASRLADIRILGKAGFVILEGAESVLGHDVVFSGDLVYRLFTFDGLDYEI